MYFFQPSQASVYFNCKWIFLLLSQFHQSISSTAKITNSTTHVLMFHHSHLCWNVTHTFYCILYITVTVTVLWCKHNFFHILLSVFQNLTQVVSIEFTIQFGPRNGSIVHLPASWLLPLTFYWIMEFFNKSKVWRKNKANFLHQVAKKQTYPFTSIQV